MHEDLFNISEKRTLLCAAKLFFYHQVGNRCDRRSTLKSEILWPEKVFKCCCIYLCSHVGQSQRSSLVLVAACCPSVREPGPAHHPGHDLPQGPPHCHPQGPHLRYAQEAAVIGQLGGTDWNRSGFYAVQRFIHSVDCYMDSFIHVLTHLFTFTSFT